MEAREYRDHVAKLKAAGKRGVPYGERLGEEDTSPYVLVYMVKLSDGGIGLILSFKGSTNGLDWKRNFNFLPTRLGSDSGVKVHKGFGWHVDSIFQKMSQVGRKVATLYNAWGSWGIPSHIQSLEDFVTSGVWKWCICVGHSLGGAMAAVASQRIASSSAVGPNTVYAVSIGAPVPGNKAFVADMKSKVLPQGGLRIENPYDLVPWTG